VRFQLRGDFLSQKRKPHCGESEWKHRPNLYQRNLKARGYMGKKLDTLDRLDDIPEAEKAVESKSAGALSEL
jgi:hypothetical protein